MKYFWLDCTQNSFEVQLSECKLADHQTSFLYFAKTCLLFAQNCLKDNISLPLVSNNHYFCSQDCWKQLAKNQNGGASLTWRIGTMPWPRRAPVLAWRLPTTPPLHPPPVTPPGSTLHLCETLATEEDPIPASQDPIPMTDFSLVKTTITDRQSPITENRVWSLSCPHE